MKNSSLTNIIGTCCQLKRVENMKRETATWEKNPAHDFLLWQDQQMLDELTKELSEELLSNGWGFSEVGDFLDKLRDFAYMDENKDALVLEIKKWVSKAEQMAAA